MEPDSQSNTPNQATPPEPEQPSHGITDTSVGAILGAYRSPSDAGWQPPTPEELQPSFAQYEIRGLLGRGGMGAVYKGWHRRLERFVAIKILPRQIDDGGLHFAARFKQEAAALAKFRHPGIIAVHDAGETPDGLLFFTMELMEGTDVAQLVATHGRVPAAQALGIASRVCEALAYAHERGVIHRDIKPSNVMIEPDGTVKVADFGLAKFSGAEKHVSTGSSLTIGTLDFMPPEALQGSRHVDHRGDIYATGGLLYQMLTGKVPHGRFEPPSMMVIGLDKRLDAVVDKAMHPDPARRHASAIELLNDLTSLASKPKQPSNAGTPVPAGPPRRPLARRVTIGLLIIGLFAIAAVAIAPWRKKIAGPPTDNKSRPEAKSPQAAPAASAHWRDAFAESPLREVIAKAGHTVQGYALPDSNHWHISPDLLRSGAVRIRATALGEKFASLYVSLDDRMLERIRFRDQTQTWVLSYGTPGTGEKDIASKGGPSPLDGQPHDLLLARTGGRLRVMFDGHLLHDEAEPSPLPGRFALDVYEEAKVFLEKAEYLELDGVPEGEALKLLSVDSAAQELPPATDASPAEFAAATKDAPFVNSLGMKFVPVPIQRGPTDGKRVLFSVWETRVQDYEVFAKETGHAWTKPKFEQGPTHPAVKVSWDDAQAFCAWLTERERRAGRLGTEESYRLPTDHEWSCAAGIGDREDPAIGPAMKSGKLTDVFPWGTAWPPPPGAGNYSGEEAAGHETAPDQKIIQGFRDDFSETAPVGSFAANTLGIFDLGGNAWEWCEDFWKPGEPARVVRGASFGSARREGLLSSRRDSGEPEARNSSFGFRVVIGPHDNAAEKPRTNAGNATQ